ncbi:MAG: flagellar hook-associated protein 3 FlgL [Gallionellaceae bacterium]|nr:MAG: flagellar hook-associated protein 3 FlgL [Gallionellaceae bacterium]
MRISTSTFYNESVTSMNQLQVNIAQTTQQLATGRKILSPADDPAAAARASELTQTDSANTQFGSNRIAATNVLSLADGVLESVTNLLLDAKDVSAAAANGMLNPAARKSMAADIQGRLQELLGLANSSDGTGNFIFAGAQGKVQPFADTAAGVVYQGDDVQRKVQAAPGRQIPITDSGADIFMRIRNGNGTFNAAPALANVGDSTISQGIVTDVASYAGQSYQVAFTVAAGVTQYTVTDVTVPATPVVVVPATNYLSGQAISFNGIQFEIKGTPANNDKFDVAPSKNQTIFDTLTKLVATLNTNIPTGSPMNVATYRQGLSDAFNTLDQSLSSVLGVRATMGARLKELDALNVTGDNLGLEYKATLSKIQDTDYNKAISELTQQQMVLTAAQKSFSQVSKMSLFDYL